MTFCDESDIGAENVMQGAVVSMIVRRDAPELEQERTERTQDGQRNMKERKISGT